MPVNIKDVARLAGVSSATVSRVLSGKPHVRPVLIKKVLAAVEELDYHPSRLARSLRVQKSSIIGLIISDIMNPFFTDLVRAAEDVAIKNGFAIFLCNADEDLEKEAMYINLMEAEKVAGVIITPTKEDECPCKRLIQSGIPVVSVDRKVNDMAVDSVLVDNVEGAYRAVLHLIEQGHERIAAFTAPVHTTTGRERLAGYRKALEEKGLSVDETIIFNDTPNKENGRIMAEKIVCDEPRPTAIFCGNNLLTAGTLSYLFENDFKIPEDFALVSFDDRDWYTMIQPTISAVRQPVYDLGKTAAELLFERIDNPDAPIKEIMLDVKFEIRQSTSLKLNAHAGKEY